MTTAKNASVVVTTGTHGNELTGVAIYQNWEMLKSRMSFTHLQIDCIPTNQAAMDAGVRFIEEDLNRQFTPAKLSSRSFLSKEHTLAKTINEALGPKGKSKTDFIIDIHNTTSAMGPCLILLEDDPFHRALGRYVKSQFEDAVLLVETEVPYQERGYLCSIGKRGVMIEMGAQPQNVMRYDVYQDCLTLLNLVLEFYDNFVSDNAFLANLNLPDTSAFELLEVIEFPIDKEGRRKAMVHPQLQDKDFQPIEKGTPVFIDASGETYQTWEKDEVVYPHFINEAAYAALHVAFATARKIVW